MDNIILSGRRRINVDTPDGVHSYFTHQSQPVEVFLDEHNIQWVKFFPVNGHSIGKEHCVRTSRVLSIVKED